MEKNTNEYMTEQKRANVISPAIKLFVVHGNHDSAQMKNIKNLFINYIRLEFPLTKDGEEEKYFFFSTLSFCVTFFLLFRFAFNAFHPVHCKKEKE